MLDGGAGSEGEGVMWVRGSDTQFDNNLVSGQSHSGSKPRTSEAGWFSSCGFLTPSRW